MINVKIFKFITEFLCGNVRNLYTDKKYTIKGESSRNSIKMLIKLLRHPTTLSQFIKESCNDFTKKSKEDIKYRLCKLLKF